MTMTRTPTCNGARRMVWLGCGLLSLLCAGTATAGAADDFGPMIHEIEVRYHVHRNFRFLMGLAGLTVKVSHMAGARSLKMALFEDQQLEITGDELDQIVANAGAPGWQPLVRSFDRRSGEHTFIYARDLGKDMRVLLVTVERNEGVVIELTTDHARLSEFTDRHRHHGMRAAQEASAHERAQGD